MELFGKNRIIKVVNTLEMRDNSGALHMDANLLVVNESTFSNNFAR